MVVFIYSRITDQHFSSCIGIVVPFSLGIPHIYPSVGYCRLLLYGSYHNLLLDKRDEPHTFGIRTRSQRLRAKEKLNLNASYQSILLRCCIVDVLQPYMAIHKT